MEIVLTIEEIENLIMMHDHCKRHFNHEYARNAIKKVKQARDKYMEEFKKQRELFDEG